MPITYIATPKSKKIMNDALRQEKKFLKTGEGSLPDWDKVFAQQWEARAKSLEEVLYTAGKGK